jgi:putative ABC transport system permease protein
MEMAQGRFFSPDFPGDAENAYVINEEAVRIMGLNNPIGKKLSFEGEEKMIIGVIRNYHAASLYFPYLPQVFSFRSGYMISIKIRPVNVPETLSYIEGIWKASAPGFPFTYDFLDEIIGSHYRADKKVADIIGYFTGLAILVSCLGLLGLAAYMAEQRTKEIGIRKVLGASEFHVMKLLSREFVLLVAAANFFAWPAAYLIMKRWLQNFAFRTPFAPGLFVFAGAAAMLIAVLAVGYQAFRAARSNPIDALRTE